MTYGSRGNRNSQQTIFRLLDTVYQNLNINHNTLALYIDLKNAFDTVDHVTLINKLISLNISHNAQMLFESHLSNCTQSVIT